MAEPNVESCPTCHEPLEVGYLSFQSYVKWCETEPSSWHGFQGKLVAGKVRWMWNRSTRAARCKKCDLILFKSDYLEGGQ